MPEKNKTVELKEEELEKVTGGKKAPGSIIYGANAWVFDDDDCIYQGEWFQKNLEPDFAYNFAHTVGLGTHSIMANKYWYKNGEAWNCGTCSFSNSDSFIVIEDPRIVHIEYTSNKPF